MAFKAQGLPKARLDRMSKAQLAKTVKALQKRETTLLNRVAKLERVAVDAEALVKHLDANDAATVAALQEALAGGVGIVHITQRDMFPWEQK